MLDDTFAEARVVDQINYIHLSTSFTVMFWQGVQNLIPANLVLNWLMISTVTTASGSWFHSATVLDRKLCLYASTLGWYVANRMLLSSLRVPYWLVPDGVWYSKGTCTEWFIILNSMMTLAFFSRFSHDSHIRYLISDVTESHCSYQCSVLVTKQVTFL